METGKFPNNEKERGQRCDDDEEEVLEIVENEPGTSVRRMQAELGISKHKVSQNFKKIIHLIIDNNFTC